MSTATHHTDVRTSPVSSSYGMAALLLLAMFVVLQLFLWLVNRDYWWDNAFWTFVTIVLGAAFIFTYVKARRNGRTWLSPLLVFVVFVILLWI